VNDNKKIAQRLKDLTPIRLTGQFSGQAAVLVSVVERVSKPHFLLTRRTQSVATHKGQISFPGGVRESSDVSLRQTALRETQEELGIDPGKIEIVGEFHEYLAATNQTVRPFVGFVDSEVTFKPHSQEVAYVLEVPFRFFGERTPVVKQLKRQGRLHDVYYYDFDGEMIWGLTARIIKDFLEFLGNPP
jgi:8-oxo-dGTP pyrophosphatase MutT (NUDIX family)